MQQSVVFVTEYMNHTTLGIVAVLAAAALVAGIFATGIQAAYAGGDSVSFKQLNKQKVKCLAGIIEPVSCNNLGINLFANLPGGIGVPGV